MTSHYLEQAKECIKLYRPTYGFDEKSTVEAIALALKSAVEAEREACAKVAENTVCADCTYKHGHSLEIAQAIRQRGEV